VSYRDDHDAALARIESLEHELAAARDDDTEQAEKIRELERALGEARVQRERAERELAALKPPPRPKEVAVPAPEAPAPTHESRSSVGPAVLVALLIAALGIGALLSFGRKGSGGTRGPGVEPRSAQPVEAATPDDTSRLIDEAIARGKQKLAGGYLSSIEIHGIDQTGKVHTEYEGALMVKFYRQRPVVPPPERPIGAPAPAGLPDDGFDCLQVAKLGGIGDWVELDSDMCKLAELYPTHSEAKPPVCTPTAIWKLARRDGAADGGLARIKYDGSWRFEIRDSRAPFEKTYDDNCTR